MTALGAAAQQSPGGLGASEAKPFSQAAPLAPSRSPIGTAQTGMPGVLGTQPTVKPIKPLSPTPAPIENMEKEEATIQEEIVEEVVEADVEETSVTKGPPGGGRMVRDSAAAPSVKGPPVRRTIQPSTPVEESVTEGMAEIRPAVDRRMLMPAEEPATAAIRPVKVMKPQESEGDTAPIKQVRILRPQVSKSASEEE